MIGGAYCPLSPRDPEQRLQNLIEQTQSNLVLMNWGTQDKFVDTATAFNIDEATHGNEEINDNYFARLSNVTVTLENIVCVIFTSGSTGRPKAVICTST